MGSAIGWRGSAVGKEVVDAEADLAGDLVEKEGGKIAGCVNGDGGGASVGVPEPFVGSALAYLLEAERGEDRDDLARPQRRGAGHGGQTWTVWVPMNSVSGSRSSSSRTRVTTSTRLW